MTWQGRVRRVGCAGGSLCEAQRVIGSIGGTLLNLRRAGVRTLAGAGTGADARVPGILTDTCVRRRCANELEKVQRELSGERESGSAHEKA